MAEETKETKSKTKWYRQRTTWTGIGAIVAGIGMVAMGDPATGIQTILGGFAAIFLRQAVGAMPPSKSSS